jgi:hypothetical protein
VEVAVEEFFASKDKEWFYQAFKELAEKWVKIINMKARILNTELLLFCMFWPIKFSFRIRHYLWDILSTTFDYEGSSVLVNEGYSLSAVTTFSIYLQPPSKPGRWTRSQDTQHNRKRHPAPRNTLARKWVYTSNTRITKRKHSSFHQQF